VRRGLLDHSDSMGATARYGGGDVQWLTAGGGIVHAEMFPLVERERDNPLELFQIWLNLPAADKMVEPYFTMLWDEELPRLVERDGEGRTTTVTVIAGVGVLLLAMGVGFSLFTGVSWLSMVERVGAMVEEGTWRAIRASCSAWNRRTRSSARPVRRQT